MLVSVIIPLYNKAKFIGSALESIRAQTHSEWEVVIVDDGSTDNGAAIVEALNDPRIRLIRQPNGGVSRARNRGIELASGDLVAFLDADDWYGPYYLETIVAMAKQHPDSQYFATSYQRLYPHQEAEWSSQSSHPVECELITNFFERRRLDGHIVHTNAVAVRKPALQQMQPCFPPGESHGEDQDLWFRLAERFPLLYCRQRLVAYRVEVEGSLVTQQASHELVPAYRRLEQRALAGQLRGSERRAALRLVADARTSVARHLIQAGKRGPAFIELWRARSAVSRHWFIAFSMATLFTPSMVRRWKAWRHANSPEVRAKS